MLDHCVSLSQVVASAQKLHHVAEEPLGWRSVLKEIWSRLELIWGEWGLCSKLLCGIPLNDPLTYVFITICSCLHLTFIMGCHPSAGRWSRCRQGPCNLEGREDSTCPHHTAGIGTGPLELHRERVIGALSMRLSFLAGPSRGTTAQTGQAGLGVGAGEGISSRRKSIWLSKLRRVEFPQVVQDGREGLERVGYVHVMLSLPGLLQEAFCTNS